MLGKNNILKDPGFWATFLLIGLLITFAVKLLSIIEDRTLHEVHLFEHVDEAREFQRECLNKPGASATVSEDVTGIMITCNWKKP